MRADFRRTLLSGMLVMAVCATTLSQARAGSDPGCASTEQVAKKKKKRGLGLGGVLGVARRAGAGSLVGENVLPQGRTGEVVREVAARAIDEAGRAGEGGATAPCEAEPEQQQEWRAVE